MEADLDQSQDDFTFCEADGKCKQRMNSRREKNKLAARRCRQRKQQTLFHLEEQVTKLQKEKMFLSQHLHEVVQKNHQLQRERDVLCRVAGERGLLPTVQKQLYILAQTESKLQSQTPAPQIPTQRVGTNNSVASGPPQLGSRSLPGVVTTGMVSDGSRDHQLCQTKVDMSPIVVFKPTIITNFSDTGPSGVQSSSDSDELAQADRWDSPADMLDLDQAIADVEKDMGCNFISAFAVDDEALCQAAKRLS